MGRAGGGPGGWGGVGVGVVLCRWERGSGIGGGPIRERMRGGPIRERGSAC